MKVGIITCMTCMFAVSLTVGGPIKSQASQSEKTVLIGGNVTFLCPFDPDVTWQWVYWKKNDETIYSLEFRSNTPWTNDTRYESSNHATSLTIKDLKKTDSGLYHCKVATLATTDIIQEGGQVLLSVTDQEVVLATISPVVPCRAFTTIPPQPAEDKAIFLVFLLVIPIIFAMCFVYKSWEPIKNLPAGLVRAFRRLASRNTSAPLATDSSNCDSREETSANGEKLPLVGPVLIDDLHCASACNRKSIVKRMRQVLHTLVEKYEDKGVTPKHGEYSAPLRKYVSSGNRCVPMGVLDDVEYFLDELDHIPVGHKRDVCEILLIMPENREVDTSMTFSNKDIFLEYDLDDPESAVKREHSSRTKTLEGQMRSILSRSETRDAARNFISLIILGAPVNKSGSASLSQQATSRYNQAVNKKTQETSFLLPRDEDSKREEDNLIEFWLSKVIKLDPAVQRRVSDRFDEFDQEVVSSTKTSETEENQLPLVGPVLIGDLHGSSAGNRKSIVKRMRKVLHSLVEKFEDRGVPPKDGEYSASLRKYVSKLNWCVPIGVLDDVEYFLDELDHIPVGRKRDVCEIMMIMPENQELNTPMTSLNKDIFLENDLDDPESAVKREHSSRTKTLEGQMRSILSRSETRDAARSYISLVILYAPVDKSGSASLSRQATSRYNQPANKTKQETSFLLPRDEDSKREEDNLIEFWLSKVIKLDPVVQRRVSDRFDEFDQEVVSSTKEQAMGRRDMRNADAKELKKISLNESIDQEPQRLIAYWTMDKYLNLLSRKQLINILQESCAPTSKSGLTTIVALIERMAKKEIHDIDEASGFLE